MPGQHNRSFVLVLLSLLVLTSCDRSKIFEKYQEIPDGLWEKSNPLGFEVEIKDTTQACNLIVHIRNSPDYPFSNLFVQMKTSFPNGEYALDTMEFRLLDPKGKPYGKKTGGLYDSPFLIDRNVKFPMAGVYRFEFSQAMRMDNSRPLPHIRSVGMRLEKSNPSSN